MMAVAKKATQVKVRAAKKKTNTKGSELVDEKVDQEALKDAPDAGEDGTVEPSNIEGSAEPTKGGDPVPDVSIDALMAGDSYDATPLPIEDDADGDHGQEIEDASGEAPVIAAENAKAAAEDAVVQSEEAEAEAEAEPVAEGLGIFNKDAKLIEPAPTPTAHVGATVLGPQPVKSAGSLMVTRHYTEAMGGSAEEPEEESEQLEVKQFSVHPANVGVTFGVNIKIRDYEFAKVSVSVNVPTYVEEISAALEFASQVAGDRMGSEAQNIRDMRDGVVKPTEPETDSAEIPAPAPEKQEQSQPTVQSNAPTTPDDDLGEPVAASPSIVQAEMNAPDDGMDSEPVKSFSDLPVED